MLILGPLVAATTSTVTSFGQRRRVAGDRLAVDEQQDRKLDGVTRRGLEAVDLEDVADRDLLLAAASADDRVHHRDSTHSLVLGAATTRPAIVDLGSRWRRVGHRHRGQGYEREAAGQTDRLPACSRTGGDRAQPAVRRAVAAPVARRSTGSSRRTRQRRWAATGLGPGRSERRPAAPSRRAAARRVPAARAASSAGARWAVRGAAAGSAPAPGRPDRPLPPALAAPATSPLADLEARLGRASASVAGSAAACRRTACLGPPPARTACGSRARCSTRRSRRTPRAGPGRHACGSSAPARARSPRRPGAWCGRAPGTR